MKRNAFILALLVITISITTIFISKKQEISVAFANTGFIEAVATIDTMSAEQLISFLKDGGKNDLPPKIHRLSNVSGSTAIVIRRFYPGNIFSIDDERYEKITITFPTSIINGSGVSAKIGDGSDIKLHYSAGPSPWPSHGCHGYMNSGTVSIQLQPDGTLEVTAIGTLSVGRAIPAKAPCPSHMELRALEAVTKYIERSPWIGAQGKFPQEETYPWQKK